MTLRHILCPESCRVFSKSESPAKQMAAKGPTVSPGIIKCLLWGLAGETGGLSVSEDNFSSYSNMHPLLQMASGDSKGQPQAITLGRQCAAFVYGDGIWNSQSQNGRDGQTAESSKP